MPRIMRPSTKAPLGLPISVVVLDFDEAKRRISLGLKQLTPDPWSTISEKYQAGQRIEGKVTSLTDFGAFVELEKGVEGLVHVSEMSWTKKNVHPGKIVSTSQEVDVLVLTRGGGSLEDLQLLPGLPPLVGPVIGEDTLWACTTCMATHCATLGTFAGSAQTTYGANHRSMASSAIWRR